MATHSSVLAWRIPGTGEPGGLPSMGSHRVGHNWSDLAAAASTSSVQFSSVAQSCPTLCDPMNCSTPGLPAHQQLPEFTQTHVHWVSDVIQPSYPLSFPSPTLNLSHYQALFNELFLCIRWPKYWNFSFSISPSNEYSGLISFRMDWISLLSKGLSRVFSNITVQKHQFFGAQLSL